MIDAALLLKDLQGELGRLSADLLTHVQEEPDVRTRLEGEWRKAFDAQRTGRTFEDWLDDRLTQVAVAWLLAFVFVRFCEDNGLIDEARIAGVGVRGGEARDAQQRFFAQHPHASDRDYLHEVLRSAATLRGLEGVVGEGESPLWLVDPPADAVSRVLALFRSSDELGELIHDFTDPELSTRFLGDLYENLSEHARKAYALRQTPEFVEEFILDRTLDPAIRTLGLARATVIDPTCGSGHFLLGAFSRLFCSWREAEPGVSRREHAGRALLAITGVDINAFAVAIARFRLLVAALVASGETSLRDAPDFDPRVSVGDSLLWGARSGGMQRMEGALSPFDRQFLYATEDADALRTIFDKRYAAVVGNPPYIVCADLVLSQEYRDRYPSCRGTYSLAVPFFERFFSLALADDGYGAPSGYVGFITANSFMKRDFGINLVRDFIPKMNLTHVLDVAKVDIPGHATPTVIIFGTNASPVAPTVRTAMGINGDKGTASGGGATEAWRALLLQVDDPGSESRFFSVADVARDQFKSHPWNIGGGGAAELKERLEAAGAVKLGDCVGWIGRTAHTGEDDAYVLPWHAARSREVAGHVARFVDGGMVRDHTISGEAFAVFPYEGAASDAVPLSKSTALARWFWPNRTTLRARLNYGKTNEERGLAWFEYSMLFPDRYGVPDTYSFAFKATHNHFVRPDQPSIFNRTAPALVFADGHAAMASSKVAVLNSALANFWVRQVAQPYEAPEPWAARYERDTGKLGLFPFPAAVSEPGDVGLRVGKLQERLTASARSLEVSVVDLTGETTSTEQDAVALCLAESVTLQEELDWECLHLYAITDSCLTVPEGLEPPPLNLGERAFEVVMARRMAAGELETAWFERHGSTPITELPGHWPDWYKDLVNERIRLIETDRDVRLIERPEHKRRWAREPWERQQERALRERLQDRLEARELWFEGSGDQERAVCRSVAQLTDRVLATDPEFLDVARLWKGGVEIDPVQVVADLVADEHVPAQSGARYKGKGFDKRRQLERTWELQKMEDDGQALPDGLERIPVPPKYTSGEFAKPSYWRHRGKLDVPKERFTSIWGAESAADGTMVLAWAGFDHVQLTQAIGALLVERQATDGWDADRSWPLVVAMAEQLFWLDLWHHEHDPRWGDSPANLFRSMVTEQAHRGGRTLVDVADWRAPAPTRGRKKKDGA